MPPPNKPRVVVEPHHVALFPTGFKQFVLKVDGERELWPTWKCSEPDVGRVDHHGTLSTEAGFRTSSLQVEGTTQDGKHSAKASVSFRVGPAPGDGPEFVDDWSIHGLGRSVEWNDDKGRRAGLLILETLRQLPDEFLRAVGHVRLIRMANLPVEGTSAQGMHLPFLRRAVLLSDKGYIDQLNPYAEKLGADPGDTDYWFVRIFIHELAHVALANRAIPDADRWAALGGLHAAVLQLLSPLPAAGLFTLLATAAGAYARFYGPTSVKDFVSQYAAVSGWVINNPNPLGMFWNQNTALPNAVTGLKILALGTGLRNQSPGYGTTPTSLDPDAHFQQFGFASEYATRDVHEDFAEAVASIAMGEPITAEPQFQSRLKFIHDKGIWPKGWAPIRPGAVLNEWALKKGRPPSDARAWAVHFGPWAGRPRAGQSPSIVVTPASQPAPSGPATSSVRAFSTGAEGTGTAEAEPQSGGGDPGAWLGTGGEQEHPWGREATEEAVTAALGVFRVAEAERAQHHRVAPALTTVRTELESLAVPLDEESRLGLLRSAERHGTGLRALGLPGAEASVDEGGVLRLAGVAARVGDLLFGKGGEPYVVAEVDAEGGIVSLAAELEETRSGKLRAPSARPEDLRYHWRPDRTPRAWDEAPELAEGLSRLIGLWGLGEGARGADLATAGGLAAEALTAYGIRHRGLLDADSDGVEAYLGKLGEGVEALPKTGATVAAGDLVRARRGRLWGVCTRGTASGGGRVDVLWQGGAKPRAGEEEDTVTLHHGVDVATLSHRWRPSGERSGKKSEA